MAATALQQGTSVLGRAIRGVEVEGGRRRRRSIGPLVAHRGPQSAGLRPAAPRIEHGNRGVRVNGGAGAHMTRDALGERRQQRLHMADPAGHDRAVDRHALARVNAGLTMQRQMIAIFGDDHMREQRRAGPPLLDRQRRHGRLDDRLAAAAAHLRPHMRHPLEVRCDIFEHPALVGPDPAEFGPSAGGADAGRVVDDRLEREMIRQRRARGRLLLRRR